MGLFSRSQKIGPLPLIANPYPSRIQQFRWRLRRYGAGGVVLVLLLISVFFPKLREEFTRSSLDTLTAFLEVVQAPIEFVRDTLQDAKSLSTLQTEIDALQGEIRYLKRDLIQFEQIKAENEIFKRYLNVPQRDDIHFYTAPVIAIPKGGVRQSLLLGLGSKDGAEEGQAVIGHQGVVGRLKTVGDTSARVRLLTDPDSRIPVYLPRLQEMAILAGNGTPYPYLVYVTDIQDLEVNEEILTSGLGGVFPQGIPIGNIQKIEGGMASVQLKSSPGDDAFLQVLQTPALDVLTLQDKTVE